MADSRPSGVPAVPNACRVQGRIAAAKHDPSGHGDVWQVIVEKTQDISGFPNFVSPYVGKTIEVYVPSDAGPRAAKATTTGRLDATVAFRGDERGGRFVLRELHG